MLIAASFFRLESPSNSVPSTGFSRRAPWEKIGTRDLQALPPGDSSRIAGDRWSGLPALSKRPAAPPVLRLARRAESRHAVKIIVREQRLQHLYAECTCRAQSTHRVRSRRHRLCVID